MHFMDKTRLFKRGYSSIVHSVFKLVCEVKKLNKI